MDDHASNVSFFVVSLNLQTTFMVTATVEDNLLLFCVCFHYLCSMLERLRFNLEILCMFPNLRPPASWMGAKKNSFSFCVSGCYCP